MKTSKAQREASSRHNKKLEGVSFRLHPENDKAIIEAWERLKKDKGGTKPAFIFLIKTVTDRTEKQK